MTHEESDSPRGPPGALGLENVRREHIGHPLLLLQAQGQALAQGEAREA